jgi:hypothetical protein
MTVYNINMSELYQIFLSEVRTFKDLKLSDMATYAGILSLAKVPYNPIQLFTAIKNAETELLSLQSPAELTSNIMYRISLGQLQDAQNMIELLRSRDYEKLNKLIFYSKAEEVKQDSYSQAPKPQLQRVNDIPSEQSHSSIQKNPISVPAPVRSSDQISLDSFKKTQDGEANSCPSASAKPKLQHPPGDISSSYLNKPIPMPRPRSPRIKVNPLAPDSPSDINSSFLSSVSSDLSRSTSIPSSSSSRNSFAYPIPYSSSSMNSSAYPIPSSSSSIHASHAKPLPISNSPVFTCEVCNQSISGERVNIPSCNHKFHKDCLINHIQLVYSDLNIITCPASNCSQDIRRFISEYLPRKINPLPVLKPALANPLPVAKPPLSNPLNCPKCSSLVSNDGSPYLNCIQCRLTFCRECRNESHMGIPCEEVKGNPKRTVKQQILQRGPERFCQTCQVTLDITKPGELIRCTICRTGHCGDCYMTQFECVCYRNKANIGVRQT